MTAAAPRQQVLALYRRIVRESRRLEPDARQYYMRFARSVRLLFFLFLPPSVTAAKRCYPHEELTLWCCIMTCKCNLQGFIGHSDETDPERIQEIVARVEQDMEWILKKYTGAGLQTPSIAHKNADKE